VHDTLNAFEIGATQPDAMLRITAITLALSACTTMDVSGPDETSSTDVTSPPDLSVSGEVSVTPTPQEPEALMTDMCDDATYTDAPWKSQTSPHFTMSFPGGSPADLDRSALVSRLESAYADIRTQLGITLEPTVTVNLSPSRVAAQANGKGMGRVWASIPRYDVVYSGAADSYERQQYGQLLTAALDYYIDPLNRYRLPVLSTGVAQVLDQSKRNYHDAYAKQLASGKESRVRIAELDNNDVWGNNVGRAGSLVKFLMETYGTETFLAMYRATAVSWNGTCNRSAVYGCIDTAEQATAMLDGVLFAKTGEHWSDIQPLWQAEVEQALERISAGMGAETTAEVENLLAVMDKAISIDSAFLYRTTMEGFYCDWGGEPQRQEIAERAVKAFGTTRTQLLALYDTGTKNFATANAIVMRVSGTTIPQFATINLEHMPVGWRVSYSPDWY
jgi:hypothetical protein